MNEPKGDFKYDVQREYTRIDYVPDRRHSAFFSHQDLGQDYTILVEQPLVPHMVYESGAACFHWTPDELAKHVSICKEALTQLDYHITAQQELAYDAYVATLEDELASSDEG